MKLKISVITLFSVFCHIDETEQSTDLKTQKVIVKKQRIAVSGVSETDPDENIEAIESMIVQKDVDQKDISLLIRMPLPAGIKAENISSAYLRLKRTEGSQTSLQASAIIPMWNLIDVTWDQINQILPVDTTAIGNQEDDWYTINVTDVVKSWYIGNYANYGLLITETNSGSKTVFYSPHRSLPEDYPELEINYEPSDVIINKYEYCYQSDKNGNCLSYSLRDINPIHYDHLGIKDDEILQVYNDEGLDGALAYIQGLTINYVEKHAESLELVSFREITSFDSSISDDEYRIALRVGIKEVTDDIIQYDYHLQVQVPNGSWAEKLGYSESRLVPGSNINLDPSLYPWDSNESWGLSKFNGFYNSRTIFYAVQKNTTDFTNHTR